MDARLEKAFDFAVEVTKLLISLSTGIIAISITFSKDIIKITPAGSNCLLFASWIIYVISIGCGLTAILSMTGNLEPKKTPGTGMCWPQPTIWAPNIVLFSASQVVSFLLATALVIAHAINNI